MRTRRRPILQDKTPGNTPQKFKPPNTRKPQLVPVVEIKARVRRSGRGKQAYSAAVDEGRIQQRSLDDQSTPRNKVRARSAKPTEHHLAEHDTRSTTTRRRRDENALAVAQRRQTGHVANEFVSNHGSAFDDPEVQNLRNLPPSESTTSRHLRRHLPLTPLPPTSFPVAEAEHHGSAYDVELDAPVAEDDDDQEVQNLRNLPPHESPTARHHHSRLPLTSLPPASFPVADVEQPITPDSIPVADEESTTSDAVRAILNTPSPTRIVRTPIPIQSTPLGRLPPLGQSLPTFQPRGRHDNSIRKWNKMVARAHSPLPPSSSPDPSPPAPQPLATSSQRHYQAYRFSDEPDGDGENYGPMYGKKDRSSDDDPFGLLAAEKKLKTIRQHRVVTESSRALGATRAPLGTLALDEVPSSVAVPDRLPTPIPSDDDHNIDDLYLDVDPVRPRRLRSPANDEVVENEDKENVPTDDYDFDENKENLPPPHPVQGSHKENDPPMDEDSLPASAQGLQTVPSLAPLLLASARTKKGLDTLLAPSSSSASPSHALRTPHKPQHAHRRTPLPTPHFSDGGLSASVFSALSAGARDESPSPVKPSVGRRPAQPRRRPLATLELEVTQPPPEVVGKKRTYARVEESSEDSDPRVAVRKLEALLPKRAKRTRTAARTRSQSQGGRGDHRAAAALKGKQRENESESTSESGKNDDSSPPRAPARVARGRGRGRGTARGRRRGRAAAPASADRDAAPRGRSTSRGRPVSKGKGKEKVVEQADLEGDEERMRKRQERIEYFRKIKEYSLEKEDIYVI